MESVVITLCIILNLLQFYQIFIFTKFLVFRHYEIRPFVIRYTVASLVELCILSYFISFVNQQVPSTLEQDTILSSFGIYLFIKFLLILFQAFIQRGVRTHKKFRIYFFLMKLAKTFLAMNCFMTIIIERNQIQSKSIQNTLKIAVPICLYIFFIIINQLIVWLRHRGIINIKPLPSFNQNVKIKSTS